MKWSLQRILISYIQNQTTSPRVQCVYMYYWVPICKQNQYLLIFSTITCHTIDPSTHILWKSPFSHLRKYPFCYHLYGHDIGPGGIGWIHYSTFLIADISLHVLWISEKLSQDPWDENHFHKSDTNQVVVLYLLPLRLVWALQKPTCRHRNPW